jgi:hypothetical protein
MNDRTGMPLQFLIAIVAAGEFGAALGFALAGRAESGIGKILALLFFSAVALALCWCLRQARLGTALAALAGVSILFVVGHELLAYGFFPGLAKDRLFWSW